jgi:hypothetical protein
MRIGYSSWGFLGAGITDTPDGGRSHRRVLIDGITVHLGHQVVFLQPDRDLNEAGEDLRGLRGRCVWDEGLPDVDVLMLEWRWPIPGRNTTACDDPGHTCDLHRQNELLDHYTRGRGVPTLIWDKDLRLAADDPLRAMPNVVICEAALHPGPGAQRLLFPVADTALAGADPEGLAALPRDLSLVYVGNQYDRDRAFGRYFAPVAADLEHLVAGKWTATEQWPYVHFTGRIPFGDVEGLHRRALATVLLAPDRTAARGQFTQRLFEAVLAGCLPITPAESRSADRVVPPELIVTDVRGVRHVVDKLTAGAGTPWHANLIAQCLRRLGPFALSQQLAALNRLLNHLTTAPPR